MKQLPLRLATVLISVALVSVSLLFPSCKKGDGINEDLAIAPKEMTGKTLKVDGVTLKFYSNTSATIVDYVGTAKTSTVSYSRKSETKANLNFPIVQKIVIPPTKELIRCCFLLLTNQKA